MEAASIDSLVQDEIHYALSNGIVYGMKPQPAVSETTSLPAGVLINHKACSGHAPFTMKPYAYPQSAFDKANAVSSLFNTLYARIANDHEWLLETLKHTGEADDFTGRLLSILKFVRSEGIRQTVTLGILRSDYMLHSVENDSRNILQVELNTISSSFGGLSTRLTEMYHLFNDAEQLNIPHNNALSTVANGIATAHSHFLSKFQNNKQYPIYVAMIAQNNERNFSDQRQIEYALHRHHRIICKRLTLADIQQRGVLDETNQGSLVIDGYVISVVYFRAGYTPADYFSEVEWDARLLLERSFAIKCPNISLHLAGCKKVQQVLAEPSKLEHFITNENELQQIRSVFAGLYTLDQKEINQSSAPVPPDSANITQYQEICQKAIESPHLFVMKPQREGGGNNIYNDLIAQSLQTMTDEQLAAFILMERIFPPSQSSILIRDGHYFEANCVCELGIFGVIMYERSEPVQSTASAATMEELVNIGGSGYLLRVKPILSDEGGVAAGYAVLSALSIV